MRIQRYVAYEILEDGSIRINAVAKDKLSALVNSTANSPYGSLHIELCDVDIALPCEVQHMTQPEEQPPPRPTFPNGTVVRHKTSGRTAVVVCTDFNGDDEYCDLSTGIRVDYLLGVPARILEKVTNG